MYGIELSAPLGEQDVNAMVDSIARKIVGRRLETPAVFFLEAHKPLSFIASQAVLVAMPLAGALLGAQQVADFSRLLRDRENIDLLISRIEDLAAEKDRRRVPASTGKE